ncbi:MAG: hypothetical protein BWX84_01043 [Verrucomicrobia bacterium ADurb.Bin118]|nr:MAG: hypothetical protein BWX84_01043 [Verrucomicrobia bacterium ADurb.Bin118]
MRFRQRVQIWFLPLQLANHRQAQFRLQPAGHADEQRVREAKDFRLAVLLQPGDQFGDFAVLVALFATQHGEQQFAHVGGAGFGGAPGGAVQQPARVEQAMQPARGFPEERGFLLQIDVDAAEKNGLAGAFVGFIHPHRQIERQHQGVVAQTAQRGDQRIVMRAIAAIHVPGAGRELNDAHDGPAGGVRQCHPWRNSSARAMEAFMSAINWVISV